MRQLLRIAPRCNGLVNRPASSIPVNSHVMQAHVRLSRGFVLRASCIAANPRLAYRRPVDSLDHVAQSRRVRLRLCRQRGHAS
jgi:hypothetical protein